MQHMYIFVHIILDLLMTPLPPPPHLMHHFIIITCSIGHNRYIIPGSSELECIVHKHRDASGVQKITHRGVHCHVITVVDIIWRSVVYGGVSLVITQEVVPKDTLDVSSEVDAPAIGICTVVMETGTHHGHREVIEPGLEVI